MIRTPITPLFRKPPYGILGRMRVCCLFVALSCWGLRALRVDGQGREEPRVYSDFDRADRGPKAKPPKLSTLSPLTL